MKQPNFYVRLASAFWACWVLDGCRHPAPSAAREREPQLVRFVMANPDGSFSDPNLATMPRRVFEMPPPYPPELREAGITGEAVIECKITAEGEVREPRVLRATHTAFGEAALLTVAKWKYEPARLRGKPVETKLVVPIVFSLTP